MDSMNGRRRAKPQYQTVSYSIFADALRALNATPAELSEALGYSRQAGADWKKTGKMPKAAALGVEALRRRSNAMPALPASFIVQVPADKVGALSPVVSAFGGSMTALDLAGAK